jgi:hypothetical protein
MLGAGSVARAETPPVPSTYSLRRVTIARPAGLLG